MASDTKASIDIDVLLDRPLGAYRLMVYVLCALVMAIEGYDMYMVGIMVPSIASAMGVEPAALASVFVAQGIGLTIGYAAIAPLADYYGRRPVILLCVAGFSITTAATAFAGTLISLSAMRLLAFIFFGGAVPNLVAHVGEMVTPGRRQQQIIMLNVMYAFGAAMGGMFVPRIVSTWGWTAPFWIGGAIPLVLLAALTPLLPESVRFMTLNKYPVEKIRRVLLAIGASDAREAAAFHVNELPRERIPLASLFREGRGLHTTVLILVTSSILFVINLVAAWLPTYFHLLSGFDMTSAAFFFALSSLGTIIWPAAGMIPLTRWVGVRNAVILTVAIGCALLPLFALSPLASGLAILISVVFGAFVVGSVGGLNALIVEAYPTRMRASALGSISGVGRLISIVGPGIGGLMLARQFSPLAIAAVISVPLVVAVAALFVLPNEKKAAGPVGGAAAGGAIRN